MIGSTFYKYILAKPNTISQSYNLPLQI